MAAVRLRCPPTLGTALLGSTLYSGGAQRSGLLTRVCLLSVCLSVWYVCMSVCLSVYMLSVCLLSVCLLSVCLSVCCRCMRCTGIRKLLAARTAADVLLPDGRRQRNQYNHVDAHRIFCFRHQLLGGSSLV